jgi:hypothetical protein
MNLAPPLCEGRVISTGDRCRRCSGTCASGERSPEGARFPRGVRHAAEFSRMGHWSMTEKSSSATPAAARLKCDSRGQAVRRQQRSNDADLRHQKESAVLVLCLFRSASGSDRRGRIDSTSWDGSCRASGSLRVGKVATFRARRRCSGRSREDCSQRRLNTSALGRSRSALEGSDRLEKVIAVLGHRKHLGAGATHYSALPCQSFPYKSTLGGQRNRRP